MSYNVFISFRFKDGAKYKKELSECFDSNEDTVDFSEDKDRSMMTEDTIKRYLYGKLRRSSVTIVLLTPLAVNHQKDIWGRYDDWMYDEIRYSLEDRENNRTNALIAVYTKEAADQLVKVGENSTTVFDVDNLFRRNMMNVKDSYKRNPKAGFFDQDYDSYCSLVEYDKFYKNPGKYIEIALEKRKNRNQFVIHKRMED